MSSTSQQSGELSARARRVLAVAALVGCIAAGSIASFAVLKSITATSRRTDVPAHTPAATAVAMRNAQESAQDAPPRSESLYKPAAAQQQQPQQPPQDPETPWRDEPWYQRMEDGPAAQQPAGAESVNRLRLDLGLDWTNAYYFRGMLKEDTGLILQPWLELGINLSEPQDNVQYELILGTWSSFHGAKTAANTSDGFSESWYEFDLYGGVAASWDAWTARAAYFF